GQTRDQGPCVFRIGRAGFVRRREPKLRDRLRPLPGPQQKQAELEADERRSRKHAGQRPEATERLSRIGLRERPDGCSGARGDVVRGKLRGGLELALGGKRSLEAPQGEAVDELRPGVGPRGGSCEGAELLRRRQLADRL